MPLEVDKAFSAQPNARDSVMRKCRESIEVKERFFDQYADQIAELCRRMADRFTSGNRLWVMGNGGSACDAQHVAVEFVHPIIEKRRPLPVLDLVSQVPVLTAISNDKDFAKVFVDQLKLWGKPGDMALALSTSGQSPNLVYALRYRAMMHSVSAPALVNRPYFDRNRDDMVDLCDLLSAQERHARVSLNELARVLGLPGKPKGLDGGQVEAMVQEDRLAEVADYTFIVPSFSIHRIQECHVALLHILWDLIQVALGEEDVL